MRFSRLVVAAICCSTAVLSQQNDIEGGLLDEEMRIDPKDGYSKSYSQFLEHYGETEGAHLWRSNKIVTNKNIGYCEIREKTLQKSLLAPTLNQN